MPFQASTLRIHPENAGCKNRLKIVSRLFEPETESMDIPPGKPGTGGECFA